MIRRLSTAALITAIAIAVILCIILVAVVAAMPAKGVSPPEPEEALEQETDAAELSFGDFTFGEGDGASFPKPEKESLPQASEVAPPEVLGFQSPIPTPEPEIPIPDGITLTVESETIPWGSEMVITTTTIPRFEGEEFIWWVCAACLYTHPWGEEVWKCVSEETMYFSYEWLPEDYDELVFRFRTRTLEEGKTYAVRASVVSNRYENPTNADATWALFQEAFTVGEPVCRIFLPITLKCWTPNPPR